LEKNLISWIDRISSKRSELGGFAICPFAKKALEDNNVYFYYIDGDPVQQITTYINCINPNMKYEVILFYDIEKKLSDNDCIDAINKLNSKYSNIIFLKDHPNNPGFIGRVNTGNGEYPVIIAQPKEKLLEYREALKKTNYYDVWDEEYLKEIWSYGDESKVD
jgi:hypothetical protein